MKAKSASDTVMAHAHISGHHAPWSLLRGREHEYYKVCFWRDPGDSYLSFDNYRRFRHAERIKREFTAPTFSTRCCATP